MPRETVVADAALFWIAMWDGKPARLLLLLCMVAEAQQIDIAGRSKRGVGAASLFDEIQDARERNDFRDLWQTRDGAKQKQLALAFVEKYPRSILLEEAYEVGARGCAALGEDAAALEWARRSLRLTPKNPFPALDGGKYSRETGAERVGSIERASSVELSGARRGPCVCSRYRVAQNP
jgi:hypothetical protein